MKRIISIVLASAMTATCAACLSGCGGGASADSAAALPSPVPTKTMNSTFTTGASTFQTAKMTHSTLSRSLKNAPTSR